MHVLGCYSVDSMWSLIASFCNVIDYSCVKSYDEKTFGGALLAG